MKKVKKVLDLIKYNLWTLVGFECLYKIITLVIFTPLFLNIFKFITKITGFGYLTLENIKMFLGNPLTIIMLVILLFLMTLYTIFDIATIIVVLDYSYQKEKISIADAIKLSLKKCKSLCKIANLGLIFLVLFLIPFLNIGVTSSFISTIKIPEFILDYIVSNKFLLGIFLVFLAFLVVILLRWLYSFHYLILENKSFKEAHKKSTKLSFKHHLKDLATIFIVQLVLALIYFIFVMLGVFLIMIFSKMFSNIVIIKSFTTTIIWIFIALSFIIHTVLATPICYATISIMYYFHKDRQKEKIVNINLKKSLSKNNKWFKPVMIGLGVTTVVIGTLFTIGIYQGKYNLNVEYTRTLEVTAHRGASVLYPENTMSAFVGAKQLGADWIELDVQQTKDEQIIVIHDTNFKRTTGVDKNTWELNYDEVSLLDAGYLFDESFKGEKIPLLKDVIKYAKQNNLKLNIELKPTGHETNFEKHVIDIIEQENFIDNCVITSQVYNVLENIKKITNDLKTVYVIPLAYGDITLLQAADYFSIEASSINKVLVKKVHQEGKLLYAWTVNTEDNIQKMIDFKVDNIITDNITLAKDTIYKSKTSNLINEYIKLIEKIFGK